jgi:predicted transcriptional regulator
MMETKHIQVEIKPFRESMDELGETMQKIAKGRAVGEEKIVFDNIDVFRRVLTPQRIKILRLIRHYKPRSVYHSPEWILRFRFERPRPPTGSCGLYCPSKR